jgi:ATP-dependent Clp endopeptidase proteolytic subunit ClpP
MKSWFSIQNKAGSPAAEINLLDEIGLWGITVTDFANALKEIPADREINVRINSPGGSVFDGIAIYNLLRARKDKVTCHVIGLAASMASIVMLAGKKTVAAENASVMIHRPWGGAMGDADEMRETADLLDKLEGQLVQTYAAKTGKSEKEIEDAMDATTWFTAQEAKDWGLVDEVGEPMALAASARHDLAKFGSVPAKISGGANNAPTNNQPNKGPQMKNLLKALVEAKLIASADASEDTAAAQVAAASAQQAQAIADAKAKNTKLEADLKAANEKIAANLKAAAEAAVEAAVKDGRLKDDKDVRAKWVEAYVRDESGTKAMLDGLAAQPKGRGNPPVVTGKIEGGPATDTNNSELKGAARVAAAFKDLKP